MEIDFLLYIIQQALGRLWVAPRICPHDLSLPHLTGASSHFHLTCPPGVNRRSPHLGIVLMSATLQWQTFRRYFEPWNPVHLHIKGRTFPVQHFFLEEIVDELGSVVLLHVPHTWRCSPSPFII